MRAEEVGVARTLSALSSFELVQRLSAGNPRAIQRLPRDSTLQLPAIDINLRRSCYQLPPPSR